MKVIEHFENATRPLISFELIPPKRGGNARDLLKVVDELAKHDPPFIDITSHPAEVVYEETPDGIKRSVKRKRPGTLGVSALIQNKYDIDAVPHVLCHGLTRQETEDFLIELRYLGIDNVLAIRGDDKGYRKPVREGRTINEYARDLVAQIQSMNEGRFLDAHLDASPADFCIGCSGYPEKHFEAPNLATDIRHTKAKVDAGASYIVTQMFFDNDHYWSYVEACRAAGITVPIIPGLKILTSRKHLTSIPRVFHCDLPTEYSEALEATKTKAEAFEVGVAWATKQAQALLEKGVPSLHFYVMSSAKAVNAVIERLSF